MRLTSPLAAGPVRLAAAWLRFSVKGWSGLPDAVMAAAAAASISLQDVHRDCWDKRIPNAPLHLCPASASQAPGIEEKGFTARAAGRGKPSRAPDTMGAGAAGAAGAGAGAAGGVAAAAALGTCSQSIPCPAKNNSADRTVLRPRRTPLQVCEDPHPAANDITGRHTADMGWRLART
jgi:hypothetical protein